jgi:hypothetical protein
MFNILTALLARLVLKRRIIILPAAEFDPPATGERRGKMKPGSFLLLVAENK